MAGGVRIRVVSPALFAAFLVAGCTGATTYYSAEDAPVTVRNGTVDPRLAATRALGGPLSPIVRNLAAPYGQLQFARGLEAYLARTLRPLDIVLVRSRPALTRELFPSHFTHAVVWLGTPEQLRAYDGLQLPRKYRGAIAAGKTVYESAGDAVRLAGIDQILNTDEIIILRPTGLSPKRAKAKYAGLLSKLGTPFDYNFDYADKSRLTCMEVVADVFPELGIPVRYSTGRFAIIPDDIVRRAISPGSGLGFVAYLKPQGPESFAVFGIGEASEALSEPSAKPALATIY
jgi:hypothetical protein